MNTDEKKKLYAALAAPFPESAIERTRGSATGRGYDTTGIKYQFIANRLCECVGLGGFRVERTVKIRETATAKGRASFDATCEVKVTLGQWTEGKFLPFAEAIGDGGHTSTSEADAIKGAFTNGFKKTVAFFGVGKQAYEGTLDDDNVPGEAVAEQQPARRERAAPAAAATGTSTPAQGQQRSRLSSKQLNALLAICRSRGWNEAEFRERVRAKHGVTMEFLTRSQASDLIGTLSGNGQDTGQAA